MTDDAPETVRPLTPLEVRDLVELSRDGVIDTSYSRLWNDMASALGKYRQLRATLARYCELATPQMHDEDCDHDDPIGLAICEMDTAVGQAELIATDDDEVAAIIISAWERLKVALFETHTEDAQGADLGDQEEQ